MAQSKFEQMDTNVGQPERLVSLFAGTVLLLYALQRRSWGRLVPAALGAGLMMRGVSGHSRVYEMLDVNTAGRLDKGVHVDRTLTVACSPEEVYHFWRNLENLPRFMAHLKSVQSTGDGRSHWVVKAPAGVVLEWDALMTEDRPNELIAWETLPGATVAHRGVVRFTPAPAGRGTEVRVTLTYEPPGGGPGEAFAQLLNMVTAQQIKEEVRRFKSVMEAGEVPTVEGQPSGRS